MVSRSAEAFADKRADKRANLCFVFLQFSEQSIAMVMRYSCFTIELLRLSD